MIPSPALTLTLTAVSGCYWLLLPTCLPFLYRSYLLIDIQVIFGFFNRKAARMQYMHPAAFCVSIILLTA